MQKTKQLIFNSSYYILTLQLRTSRHKICQKLISKLFLCKFLYIYTYISTTLVLYLDNATSEWLSFVNKLLMEAVNKYYLFHRSYFLFV